MLNVDGQLQLNGNKQIVQALRLATAPGVFCRQEVVSAAFIISEARKTV